MSCESRCFVSFGVNNGRGRHSVNWIRSELAIKFTLLSCNHLPSYILISILVVIKVFTFPYSFLIELLSRNLYFPILTEGKNVFKKYSLVLNQK